ncbi:MAG: 3-oxoacid CoA-transferase subunit A [Rhodospirillales bacterium]|nr:3-oxoacid CoA-transferase subunit A [Rhodospirillales bacterium]
MIDKQVASVEEAVAGIKDGAVILVGGFGNAGEPIQLLNALALLKPQGLTIVSNNAGSGEEGIGQLILGGCVKKFICSFPRVTGADAFDKLYAKGELELEIVPQGTLAERVRAAGAGIPAFYTRTSAETPLAEGKEIKVFKGKQHVLEHAIYGDVALVKAAKGDRWGNLTYTMSSRNFNPVMAMGAELTIAQVSEVVELGGIEPEQVITPSIFVDRIVQVEA